MLDTLKAALIVTVPVPMKLTQALALPLMTVATGTDEVPATLLSVVVLMVDMI